MIRHNVEPRVNRIRRHKLPERTEQPRKGVPVVFMLLLIVAIMFLNKPMPKLKKLDSRVIAMADVVLEFGIGSEFYDEVQVIIKDVGEKDKFSAEMLKLISEGKAPSEQQLDELKNYSNSKKILDAIKKAESIFNKNTNKSS